MKRSTRTIFKKALCPLYSKYTPSKILGVGPEYRKITAMLKLQLLLLTVNFSSTTILRDPLEQFDVLALPAVGGGLTNLSLILALNVFIMAA